MARTKKIPSVEEQLEELEKEIDKCETQIKEHMDKKNMLIRSMESKKMGMLYQAMSESNKSIDDVISWLRQDKQQNTEQN